MLLGPTTYLCASDSPFDQSGLGSTFCIETFEGGFLEASGVASVASDTIALLGSHMSNSSALYFQGTQRQNGGAGSVFGDGLRCAGGSVVRLGTRTNAGGASQYPSAGDPPVSVRGSVAPGNVRAYQVWYRNAAAFCTASTFNLSNGLELVWQP